MQVSVEKTSELSRKLTVSVPLTVIQEKINAQLVSLGRDVKVHGFRPGKVPLSVLSKMYGAKVREEVVNEFLNTSYQEALQEHQLNPVNQPNIEFVEEPGHYKYTAEFEVYPEIHLEQLSQIELLRPVCSVTEANVDGVIEAIRTQKIQWNTVTRPAETGDRLTLSFSGWCDGVNFTNGRVDNYVVVIGSKQMIQGFEDNLLGLETGSAKTFDVTFPEHYKEPHLAGKAATFEVNVIKIEVSMLPEINAEFIKAYGAEDGSLASFREHVKNNLVKNLEQALYGKLRDAVITAVHEKIQVTVPSVLIDEEIKRLQKRYEESVKAQQDKPETLVQLPREHFEEVAKRRTGLGLIFNAIAHDNNLHLTDDKVRSAVESLAKNYEDPKQVIDWHYADKERLNEVQQMVFENQVIDWIVSQAQVSEVTVAFSDVMRGQ